MDANTRLVMMMVLMGSEVSYKGSSRETRMRRRLDAKTDVVNGGKNVNDKDIIVMIFIGYHLDKILTLVRSEVWMILLPSPEPLLGPKLLQSKSNQIKSSKYCCQFFAEET